MTLKNRIKQLNRIRLMNMSKSSGDKPRAQECIYRLGGGLLSPVVVCGAGHIQGDKA